jgi:hypothetical protein
MHSLPAFLAAEPSAPARLPTTVEPPRASEPILLRAVSGGARLREGEWPFMKIKFYRRWLRPMLFPQLSIAMAVSWQKEKLKRHNKKLKR